MREIKLMAWHREQHKMYGPWTLQNLLIETDSGQIGLEDWHKTLSADELIFREFTGLKDTNDKEVYEGDVVRQIHGKNIGFTIVKDDCGLELKRSLEDSGGIIEVIGNIYEHGHFLALDKGTIK